MAGPLEAPKKRQSMVNVESSAKKAKQSATGGSRGEIDPGVGRVKAALAAVGSPHTDLARRCLHVAGTNGKGSVCAMAYTALREAGLSVGLFTSPHLLEPLDATRLATEGVEVQIDPGEWSQLREEVLTAYSGLDADASLTTFELQVVMTFLLFARSKVDVAVIEVGLGGRDDATNVLVSPAVCAITSIALDHEAFLGTTREEIARHKAGIFQKDCPALIASNKMAPSVRKAIEDCAAAAGASPMAWIGPGELVPLETAGLAQRMRVPGLACPVDVPLHGDYQLSNTALAVAILLQLRSQLLPLRSRAGILSEATLLDDRAIASGIASTKWKGRLEWYESPVWGSILLDGAHNLEAASALGDYVDKAVRGPGKAVVWVVGMSMGKDSSGVLKEFLRGDKDALITVPFGPVDGMPWVKPQAPDDLVQVARATRQTLRFCRSAATLSAALDEACQDAQGAQLVVCGSLYLVADFVRLLGSK